MADGSRHPLGTPHQAQQAAFLIADNRLTESSSWDDRLLGEHLKTLSEMDLTFELSATG